MSKVVRSAVLLVVGVVIGQSLLLSASAQTTDEIAVLDRMRILDLISRYSHTWDSKNSVAWTELFTDDAISQNYSAAELVSEARSSTERLMRAQQRHGMFTESGIQTRHHQTNTVLTPGPNGSVSGETDLPPSAIPPELRESEVIVSS